MVLKSNSSTEGGCGEKVNSMELLLAEKARKLSDAFNVVQWRREQMVKLIMKHASKGEFSVVWTRSWDEQTERWLVTQGFKLEHLYDAENEKKLLGITWRKW